MDIAAWLCEIGLEQYTSAFLDNGIDARVLPKLTPEDLKEIGISMVGHRRLLLEAIAALREPSSRPALHDPERAFPMAEQQERKQSADRSPSCSVIWLGRPSFRSDSIRKTCAS
jgi:hypothetical protein